MDQTILNTCKQKVNLSPKKRKKNARSSRYGRNSMIISVDKSLIMKNIINEIRDKNKIIVPYLLDIKELICNIIKSIEYLQFLILKNKKNIYHIALNEDIERNCDKKEENAKSLSENLFRNEMQHVITRIEMLEKNLNSQLEDYLRIQTANDSFKSQIKILNENFRQHAELSQNIHKAAALNQVSYMSLDDRIINLEKLSFDGTLLWKITNVTERIQFARNGSQTSFYSPPFFTSRNGYKMCCRIYLNGDGNGRNTHLSIFFVIMRGEYDSLLKWPFKQKVTLILIDQTQSSSKENIYDAFRPDPNSSSFKRPISDMNVASGLPVFCPLSKLLSSDHEYVKDNTMFIKIIVDTNDLINI